MACVNRIRVGGEFEFHNINSLSSSPTFTFLPNNTTTSKMAPALVPSPRNIEMLRRAAVAAGPGVTQHLMRRSLKVNDAQKVTLGIIAVYIVVIALLWNIPYVRWSLWPFKVSHTSALLGYDLTCRIRCWLLPSTNSATRSRHVVQVEKLSPYRLIHEKEALHI